MVIAEANAVSETSSSHQQALDGVRRRWEGDPYIRLLGIEIVSMAPARATLRLPFAESIRNAAHGAPHGGAICSLIDVAVAIALNAANATAGEGAIGQTTTDINVSFLAAARQGPLTAEARLIRRGRTLAVGEAMVTDGAGNEVAAGRATFMLFRPSTTDEKRISG